MNGSNSVILMISDGLGFEGWRAADVHERGAPRRQAYQGPRPDGGRPVVLGKSQTALLESGERRPDGLEARHPFIDACEGAIDSAAAATAPLSGRWVPNGRINVAADGARCVTLAEEALARGLGAGVVTSVQAAHATPAAAAARAGAECVAAPPPVAAERLASAMIAPQGTPVRPAPSRRAT